MKPLLQNWVTFKLNQTLKLLPDKVTAIDHDVEKFKTDDNDTLHMMLKIIVVYWKKKLLI